MLKHADRDASVALDPTALNNIEVLIQAIGGYLELRFPLSIEMETYYFYWGSLHPELFHDSETEDRRLTALKRFQGQGRLEACRFIIDDPLLADDL